MSQNADLEKANATGKSCKAIRHSGHPWESIGIFVLFMPHTLVFTGFLCCPKLFNSCKLVLILPSRRKRRIRKYQVQQARTTLLGFQGIVGIFVLLLPWLASANYRLWCLLSNSWYLRQCHYSFVSKGWKWLLCVKHERYVQHINAFCCTNIELTILCLCFQ